MSEDDGTPPPPSNLPSGVVDVLDGLNGDELRGVIDYAQELRRHSHPDVTERIELARDEDVVRIEEHPEYTLVVKSEPLPASGAERSRGQFLYKVSEEPRQEGGTSLHWTYLGRVHDDEGPDRTAERR